MAAMVDAARAAFEARAWAEAFALFEAADDDLGESLAADDLRLLADAAYLCGRDEDSHAARERAHAAFLDHGEPESAALCAHELGMSLLMRGEMARAGGWLARARRLVADLDDSVVHGYLHLPEGLRTLLAAGDGESAQAHFAAAAEVGERAGDADLLALARLGLGQSLLLMGRGEEGMALLDEVMLDVTSGTVSPIPAGVIYCAVIEACTRTFDLRRAQEWTTALSDWCDAQPELVPFRGQCLVHRSQILQLHGAWPDAMDEAQRACERLGDPPGQPAVGAALYQCAELHRLRGELAEADRAYREASNAGHPAQPGLALLRLAEGDRDAAEAAIRRALAEHHDLAGRARLLAAQVEIALAPDPAGTGPAAADRTSPERTSADRTGPGADRLDDATAASDELTALAAEMGAPLLHAIASHASGAALSASGASAEALIALRRAAALWRQIDAPYELARTRILLAEVCDELSDRDAAAMERNAARTVFSLLGAGPELARLEATANDQSAATQTVTPGGLSPREVEVLRLVAGGRSNRAVAEALVISEHTVARHVQNIFVKLGVGSRTAAAAFAFEHDLA